MKVLIAGASGMCGRALLDLLLTESNIERIYIPVRKSLGIQHPKIVEIISDLKDISADLKDISIDYIYCCLGTTIKKAGSEENFIYVDLTLVDAFASFGEVQQVKYFGVISAMGASKKSAVFYNRVKGEMEEKISLKKIPHISIYRPSLLMGDRTEKRSGEKLAMYIFKLLAPIIPKKYKGIYYTQVASAMYRESIQSKSGVNIYENNQLLELATQ